MAELRADGAPVQVSGARVSSAAVEGDVVPATSLRGTPRNPLVGALARLGLRPEVVLGLDAKAVGAPSRGLLRSLVAPPQVVVEVAPPPPDQGQVLLVDDGGAVSWVLPERPPDGGARSRAAAAVTRFRVPVAPTADADLLGPRGLIGKAVRRVLHVLTFDLVDQVAGKVGDHFVTRWEEKQRPHRLRSFTATDYRDPTAPSLDAASLRSLARGPALLLLHGTNSLSHSGFAPMPPDAVAALNDRYRGRVFAFDHPTLSVDPLVNGRALAGLLPGDLTAEVDVLAHSRGGLVGRVLAELPDAAGMAGRLTVRQLVFVATPNLGTPLADPDHFGKLLDGLTNLLDLVPDNPVTDSLAGIVAVVRQLAVGAAKGLDGLMAMNPRLDRNPFLTALNGSQPHPARYRAVAADYEPAPDTPRGRWVRDAAIDAVFGWEPNDLIVPTASAYSWNGAANFPVTERIVLPAARSVDHSTFWTAPEALDAFRAWLSADASALAAPPSRDAVRLAQSSGDPLSEVDERLAAGDIEGMRKAVRALPAAELDRLQASVGDVALDSFVSPGLREPKAGVVFLVPGMMGSELWADDGEGDRIWLNPLGLAVGRFRRLRVADGAGGIRAGGLYRTYRQLVMAIDAGWEVVPFGYDWRLPLEAAADSLADRIRERSGGRPMPAHLVCHSTGGLVARMLMARHPDVWRDIDAPEDRAKGGRLVMLGTPTLGSFAIALALTGDDHLVQWLDLVDVSGSREEILSVLGSFPGAYQLLTSPDAQIGDSGHAELYDAGSWGSGTIVAGHLAAAGASHRLLAESGVDPERMYYVAGAGHPTPAAVSVDAARPGRFSYRMTTAGDGRVSHQLGVPVDAGGEPVFGKDRVWYSTARHGDLPQDREVVAAVVDVLGRGGTGRLPAAPPAAGRGAPVVADGWVPAELVEPPVDAEPAVAARSRSGRPTAGTRARLRAEVQAATDRAVGPWLGTPSSDPEMLPVLGLRVLHASLEYSSYPVMVGHYSGDPIAGAEGYLDWKLGRQLTARQVAGRYPEALEQVLRVPTGGRPPGALVIGLGPRGDLTSAGLAGAARAGALEHALAWLDDPNRVGDGSIGLSTCLIGSYGVAGLTLASSVAAIVEGVVLANVGLADSTEDKVRIGSLEFVERYAGAAEEAAHVIRNIEGQLPGALAERVDLRPDMCLRPGEGRRPAVRTADYGAGQWHRIAAKGCAADIDGRMTLRFTSYGARARADELEQQVDVELLGRMLEEAVLRPAVDGRINTAMFEMLFPNAIKRDLSGVENIHLVVDEHVADFPWEALSDRGGSAGGGPVALRGGFLRQLSLGDQRSLDPLTGVPGALVVGDPPGGELFPRLEGARREAHEVAELLAGDGRVAVERLIFPADASPEDDSASRVMSALLGGDYRIVHVAGHGHFEPRGSDSPFGGVVIGPGAYLTAASLRSMRRPPDVVFLNCCHLGSLGATNIDDPATADKRAFTRRHLNRLAASLSRELTMMGVRAVVVAGWAVSDAPAAEFARAFYGEMLAGVPFGDAVRLARTVAFAADGGASNTWAAYQCYGDPAFRLRDVGGESTVLPPPVSADEMQRRLEEIEVAAREADEDYRRVLSQQVRDQYPVAEKEWPGRSRMWTAFGWAHATLGEMEPAITAYRRALDRQDGLAPLKAVEELAEQEHRLYIALRQAGRDRAEGIDRPSTQAQLRKAAWERLRNLDRLGRSSERHALRARWHEREARLESVREPSLSAAAEEYVASWRLSHEDQERRSASLAIRARQLLSLGATVADEELRELTRFLDAWRSTRPAEDFASRVAVADLVLAECLPSIDTEATRADVLAAYHRVFRERSVPDQRAKVTGRVTELSALVDGPQEQGLIRLVDDLADWSPTR